MEITISEARKKLSDLINEVAFGKKRFVLSRRGKRLAALIPLDDERQDNAPIKQESKKAIKEEGK